jgi:type IV pilus assembly protein PilO
MTVTRKWSLLAAVLVLAILAAGWFLLVSPKRDEAAQLRTNTASQEEKNDRLLQQLEVLKAQQAELPKQRAKLAVFRTQIPDNPALPTLIRDLSAAGRKVGVSIEAMEPALPTPVVVAQPAPVAPATGSTGSSASGSTGATAAPAPPAPSLYQVPLTLEIRGTYFELEQFVNKLEGLKRSFLVTGFTVDSSVESATAVEGDTATSELLLTLQGRVFLSPAQAPVESTAPTAPSGTTGTTPAAS